MNEITEKKVPINVLINSFEKTRAPEETIESLYEEMEEHELKNGKNNLLMYTLRINCQTVTCYLKNSSGSVGFEFPKKYFEPILNSP